MSVKKVTIIGAGLAGSEAAYYLAEHDVKVSLYEMRSKKNTEAHKTSDFAELVCSNSLKSKSPYSAPWALKSEMSAIGSIVLQAAEVSSIPGGNALTVDRNVFSAWITNKIKLHKNIEIFNEELTSPPTSEHCIIATGPLTSEKLFDWILKNSPEKTLYFYDAIAPIVEASSINMEKAFLANRYDKGGEDAYINCPLSKKEYLDFINILLSSETVPPKNFEKEILYQGCQPIESIAATGVESLRFGPMKPVGLIDPKTGLQPYAAIQLRAENQSKSAYNLVGFQTKLKYGEQAKVFKKIPALENAEFLRFGSIHRNTYVCSPKALNKDLTLQSNPLISFAGQITGVEGYVESAACGLLVAYFTLSKLLDKPITPPPINTALGSLYHYLTQSTPTHFQPTNIHFGLLEPTNFNLPVKIKKDQKRELISKACVDNFKTWWEKNSL